MRWMKHRFSMTPRAGNHDLFSSAGQSYKTVCPPPLSGSNQHNAHRLHHANFAEVDPYDSLRIKFTISRTSADGDKMHPRSIYLRSIDLNEKPYIESGHPAIGRVAHKLESADGFATADNIFD
jgi:hypothetical protein